MGFQLTIAGGPEAGKALVFDQPSVVVGRTPECDIILYDPGVSRRHARIFLEAGVHVVEDMGSSNGTRVNGEKVKRQELFDGDSLGIGGVSFTFSARDNTDVSDAPPEIEEGKTRIVASPVEEQGNLGDETLSFERDSVPGLELSELDARREASDRNSQETRIKPLPARKPGSAPRSDRGALRALPPPSTPPPGPTHPARRGAAPSHVTGVLPARRSTLAPVPDPSDGAEPDTGPNHPSTSAPRRGTFPPTPPSDSEDEDADGATNINMASAPRRRGPTFEPDDERLAGPSSEEGATSINMPSPPRRRPPPSDPEEERLSGPSSLARSFGSALEVEGDTGPSLPGPAQRGEGRWAAMSAAERARFRREARGLGGAAQVFWLDSSPGKKAATGLGLLLLGVALAGAGYSVYRMQRVVVGPPEPSILTREPMEASFGLGPGVKFVEPDKKVFTFEFNSPIRAMAILHYQAKDISEGEVAVSVNGGTVGTVPPDTLNADARPLEVVLPAQLLKKGEKNTLVFDNVHNPPNEESWRVWNLWVETQPLPELPPQQLLTRAGEEYKRGLGDFEAREIDKSNRYKAWKEFRNAWLMLQGYPDPKPELFALARDKMLAAQVELDRQCSALLLEVDKDINQSDRTSAAAALADVEDWFPAHDQPCPWRAARKRDEYGL